MTVLENVALGGYLRGASGTFGPCCGSTAQEERRLFAEAERQLARIGMADRMHELAGNLALGPQRLMEIARALCTDPALLLLDEPAAGLRHKEKQALADVLRQLKRRGHEHAAGGTRHGLRDGPDRPHRGDGVRHQADGRHAGRSAGQPARSAPPISGRSTEHGADTLQMALLRSRRTCTPATAAPRCCTGLNLQLPRRPGRHRDRPQRRRQVDHAQRADGLLPRAAASCSTARTSPAPRWKNA
jgi:hypothetical protein